MFLISGQSEICRFTSLTKSSLHKCKLFIDLGFYMGRMGMLNRIVGVVLFLIGLVGCSLKNVAIVTDRYNNSEGVEYSTNSYVLPMLLEGDEQLVLLRITNHNPQNIPQDINVEQLSSADGEFSGMKLNSTYTNMDDLVLFKLNSDAGRTAYMQPFPCSAGKTGMCHWSRSANEQHIEIKVPRKGVVAYAGQWNYEIVDLFPHRKLQNNPVVKNMKVKSNFAADLKEALVMWPFLDDMEIIESPAILKDRRASVFEY